jgi:hypothetical protein
LLLLLLYFLACLDHTRVHSVDSFELRQSFDLSLRLAGREGLAEPLGVCLLRDLLLVVDHPHLVMDLLSNRGLHSFQNVVQEFFILSLNEVNVVWSIDAAVAMHLLCELIFLFTNVPVELGYDLLMVSLHLHLVDLGHHQAMHDSLRVLSELLNDIVEVGSGAFSVWLLGLEVDDLLLLEYVLIVVNALLRLQHGSLPCESSGSSLSCPHQLFK